MKCAVVVTISNSFWLWFFFKLNVDVFQWCACALDVVDGSHLGWFHTSIQLHFTNRSPLTLPLPIQKTWRRAELVGTEKVRSKCLAKRTAWSVKPDQGAFRGEIQAKRTDCVNDHERNVIFLIQKWRYVVKRNVASCFSLWLKKIANFGGHKKLRVLFLFSFPLFLLNWNKMTQNTRGKKLSRNFLPA